MLEVVVVGAGQAGLAMSDALSHAGIEHVVLERGRVGETWRTQRWDTFALNTPGWYSLLPGDTEGASAVDGFATRDVFVAYLERHARAAGTPLRTGVAVTRILPAAEGRGFRVEVEGDEPFEARAVVVASGIQNVARLPALASELSGDIRQMHSTVYRNAAALPPGGVLVVGSAQSGMQIAEDLLEAGRDVHLATSAVGRMRRRYRGRDMFGWLLDAQFFAQTVAHLPDPAMQFAPQPQISGIGPRGHSVSLQWLGERGVRLLGHIVGASDGGVELRDDLGANVAWGDKVSAQIVQLAETAVAASDAPADGIEDDPGDAAHPDPTALHGPTRVNLHDAGISTVIWTTGVRGSFSHLPDDAVNPDGRPAHVDGVTRIPGLFVIGFPWLRNRASGIIPGVGPDAAFLVDRIRDHLGAAVLP